METTHGTHHWLIVNTTAGVEAARPLSFSNLAYQHIRNGAGQAKFDLQSDDPALSVIADKCQLEIYRKNADMARTEYLEWEGIIRAVNRSRTDHTVYHVTAYEWNHLLSWRSIAWYAATSNRSSFVSQPAETVMKTLLLYNLGASATTGNGRLRAGNMTGITAAADGAAGNTVDIDCAYDNLLTTLQNVAKTGGGDFALVKTAAAAWEFRWYTGQLGTDRTATVIFSIDHGNMVNPVYEFDRSQERTVCIAGGQGENSDRVTAIATGANYNATTNNIEDFQNSSAYSTSAGVAWDAARVVKTWQAKEQLRFSILQTPQCFYGLHYVLGDKVTADWSGTSMTQIVDKVSVSVPNEGHEIVTPELVNA